MRGVHLDEPTSPLTKQWNEDIDDFVLHLTNPKSGVDHSQSIDVATLDKLNKMKLQSSEQSSSNLVRSRQSVPESLADKVAMKDKKCETSSPRKSWRKHILQRRNGKSLSSANSADIDETVEVSFNSNEDEGLDMKDISFDSTSSGARDSKVSFHCDSSQEDSDPDTSSTHSRASGVHGGQKSYHKKDSATTAKDKESKKRRFRRMITRPLRRSQSAGCEKDIPAHALFLQHSEDKPESCCTKDTMESRAADLSLYHRQLFGVNADQEGNPLLRRPVHKTCSADAAMMATEEFGIPNNNSRETKSKSRNLAKNVKRKFQFLRRRNTDTALGGGMLSLHGRPTSEQASLWSQSFDCLLGDKSGLELFRGFLRSEFSEENLEFWIACQDYKSCKDSKLSVQAQRIYGDYVALQAPKEVNLDSKTRMQTISSIECPTRDTFEQAQKRIQTLMEKDSYPRFLESEIYQQLLNFTPDNGEC